ncbi:hypothetical protein [Bradyrhizobium sp. sGM-13]|uniref:hypothetical protein n=1 Tax=Bradyrhizobium sp. sGM-13 TaxID=2831781 RepID=UPI0020C0845F|nr:hypothetical protein [Bradyrhizobium sp. sGM-13]
MKQQLNKRIRHLEMPKRLSHLPISSEGFPVPYFVPWVDGKPEFRGFDGEKLGICVRHKRCWLCGETLGKWLAFTVGPMCGVNRTSAEPPSHYDCSRYAVSACPFLTQPRMRRNEADLPEHRGPAGFMIRRNPGVTLIWVTDNYKPFRDRGGVGVLFHIGELERVEFYAEGRAAMRDEIMVSIDSGMPILREMAELDGPEAIAELDEMYSKAMQTMGLAA